MEEFKMVVKKKKASAVTPEEVKDVKVENEFKEGTALLGTVLNPMDEFRFSVKLDAKKFEGRSLDQVHALFAGSVGAVKKIIIEQE